MSGIPGADRILFIGSELQARARLEGPSSLSGRVDAVSPSAVPNELEGYGVVVVDLDESGTDAVARLHEAGFAGRIVGFYSHVNESLGAAARGAAIEAYPRGRFWRDLELILGRRD